MISQTCKYCAGNCTYRKWMDNFALKIAHIVNRFAHIVNSWIISHVGLQISKKELQISKKVGHFRTLDCRYPKKMYIFARWVVNIIFKRAKVLKNNYKFNLTPTSLLKGDGSKTAAELRTIYRI